MGHARGGAPTRQHENHHQFLTAPRDGACSLIRAIHRVLPLCRQRESGHRLSRKGIAHFALWAAAALAAPLARAQSVRGTVVRPADGAGIPGVVVLLIDSRDSVVARALTNERGEYRVTARSAGTYRERTLRIGYRPFLSEPFSLAPGPELVRRLSLASLAFSLDTVRVVNVNSCGVRSDTATATFAIWEQIRAALTATQLSSGNRSSAARVVTYDRTLEADGRRIREQHSALAGNYSARPWQAQSGSELHSLGYVRDEADGGKTYLAPDIDVLLSDTFLDDHCFRIARSEDRSQIGLEFEPSRERRSLPDIRGIIWLDRASAELDRVDFRYANVSREEIDGGAGGTLAFVRMANSEWTIARWSIRMPVLERRETGGFGAPRGWDIRVAEIKVAGGELALVVRGRDTLWARAPLLLSGTTVDSVTGRTIEGARVAILGAGVATRSDTEGHFTVAGLLPGVYTLEVRTPSLDALGAVVQREITFTDGAAPLRVSVPSSSEVASSACAARPSAERGIITGLVTVRGETAAPPRLGVLAEWTDASYDVAAAGGRPNSSSVARTDARGRFWVCGVPRARDVVVRVVSDSFAAAPAPTRIDDGLLARVDLVADALATRTATFTGVVVADSAGAPLADVEVELPDLGRKERSDAKGVFRFSGVPLGTHALSARRVGYGALEASVRFDSSASVYRRVVLTRMASLDSVRVTATRETLGAGLAGFEERRRLGFGKFIPSEIMRANEHRKIQDLLTGFTGIKVMNRNECRQIGDVCRLLSPTARYAATTRIAHISPCFLDVLLDGVRVGKGGISDWTTAYDLDMLPVSGLESIEVYRSAAEVPTVYGGPTAQCGVILLWSRNSR